MFGTLFLRAGATAVTCVGLSALVLSSSQALASVPSPPTTQTTASVPTGPGALAAWATENEAKSHKPTREQAVATARSHMLVVALPNAYKSHLEAMRTANPELTVLTYMNGTFAQGSQGSLYPDDWYARDAKGAKIRSLNFGNYLMNPASSGWRADRAKFCAQLLAASGYDGCMLDMLGTAPLGPGYGTGLPINPRTGAVWTSRDWLAATGGVAAAVKSHTGRLVFGNGAGSGTRYWDPVAPTSALLSSTDGVIAEIWLRTANAGYTKFPTETTFRQAVDQLVDAGARDKTTLVMVKMWAAGTQAEKDRWHEYALATFLLGADGKARFSASYGHDDDPTTAHSSWSAKIGTPTGSYTVKNGVYQRTFTNGIVMVNPGTSTVMVELGSFTGESGAGIASIVIPAQTGMVLPNGA